jgi:hypothetical protein
MLKGIYKRWNPVPQLEGTRLYCEAIHDDWEGFRIWLGGEPAGFLGMIIVRFDAQLLYTKSDEDSMSNIIENPDEVLFPHTFWKVEKSALVEEFQRQSGGVYTDDKITHYAFLSCNDCIDVLSISEPTFSYDAESLSHKLASA